MKKNRTKRDITKFTVRNTHKRREKNKMRDELMRAVMASGVGTDALKLTYSNDRGRRSRKSEKQRADEVLARGVFSSSKTGFGFVTLDEGYDKDIFIPEDRTGGAIDGDYVEIIYHVYNNRFGEEKTEGRVKKIIKYGRMTVIGTVERESVFRSKKRSVERFYVQPDESRINIRPYIRDMGGASVKDKVEALIIRDSYSDAECSIVRNFGNTYTKKANYEAILAESEIPVEFSKEELVEAEFFASAPISEEGRVKFQRDVIFTIDGEGAKDLDDAVSLRRLKEGWLLGVHIADVSNYVKERTHLDRAVMARGTSVYFTDKVVPMLPPCLSNGACSLNAGEEKYALSLIARLDKDGNIISSQITPSVIKSRVRGVYSEVNDIFSGKASSDVKEKYKAVLPSLKKMRELYLILEKKNYKKGALRLETSEAEIILSGEEPIDIIRRNRGDAEKMIEQFMLLANEAVATLLYEKKIPCVYRVHEEPEPKKLDEFLVYMHNLGFDTSVISRERVTPSDFSRLLSMAEERGILSAVSYSMLRAMSKAKYSDKKGFHFGLSTETYCHFTSPIRRLSDLATHRIIHKVLIEGKRPEIYKGYAKRAAAAATDAELRALSAERKIENLYKVIYMEKFIGQDFLAKVSSVSSFGLFAELSNTCEGLVPISEMPGMFVFDEKNLTLRSRDAVYRLGDEIRVKLEDADIIKGKLRFSILEMP